MSKKPHRFRYPMFRTNLSQTDDEDIDDDNDDSPRSLKASKLTQFEESLQQEQSQSNINLASPLSRSTTVLSVGSRRVSLTSKPGSRGQSRGSGSIGRLAGTRLLGEPEEFNQNAPVVGATDNRGAAAPEPVRNGDGERLHGGNGPPSRRRTTDATTTNNVIRSNSRINGHSDKSHGAHRHPGATGLRRLPHHRSMQHRTRSQRDASSHSVHALRSRPTSATPTIQGSKSQPQLQPQPQDQTKEQPKKEQPKQKQENQKYLAAIKYLRRMRVPPPKRPRRIIKHKFYPPSLLMENRPPVTVQVVHAPPRIRVHKQLPVKTLERLPKFNPHTGALIRWLPLAQIPASAVFEKHHINTTSHAHETRLEILHGPPRHPKPVGIGSKGVNAIRLPLLTRIPELAQAMLANEFQTQCSV